MNLRNINHLLIDAKTRNEKDKAFQMWIAQHFPIRDKNNFVEFKDFFKKLITPVDIPKSDESIQDRYKKFKPGVM